VLSRRQFLRAAGVGAVAALAGCADHTRERATPTTVPPTTVTPSTAVPAPADWEALARTLHGELLRPQDPAYDYARRLYNTRFDGVRPEAVARCVDVDDVRACVAFAAQGSVPLAVRSGGHSYAGWSTGPGLVVDVSPIDTIELSGDRLVVGAGARLVDVYAQAAEGGMGVPAGSCPTVGVTGLTLGGGLGVLTRAWGLTCDNLIEAVVVTSDAHARTCDARREPDLFWALRGGGGGNFGVVTSLTLRARPAGSMTTFFLRWPWNRAHDVVRAWQGWVASAPDALWANCHLLAQPAGTPRLAVNGLFVGTVSELGPQLDRLATMVGTPASTRTVSAKTFLGAMLTMAGCADSSVAECHLRGTTPEGTLERETYAAKSHVIATAMGDAAIGALVDGVNRRQGTGGAGGVLLDALGGAVDALASDATAFPHRGALAVAQYIASWSPLAPPSTAEQSIAWLRSYRHSMVPHLGNRAYVNYIDPDLTDWPAAYYGDNYARLQKVKATYDPDGLFVFPQAISA
jgi:FAD/FMN-containing dehydrogenase